MIRIIPVKISADFGPNDNLSAIILEAAGKKIRCGDILVIAHKIVSKTEGNIVNLASVKPSNRAVKMGKEHGKDPRIMELILKESVRVLRAKDGIVVSETSHGLVCANAGVDQSNVRSDSAVLLPVEPDTSANKIRNIIRKKTGKDVAIIITDTFGRPFREGQINVAIGIAGLKPIRSYVGSRDMFGRMLKVSEIAVADELASAAELVMGKAKGVPVAIIRGYKFEKANGASSRLLQRPRERDLFR